MLLKILYVDDDLDDHEIFGEVASEINSDTHVVYARDAQEMDKYLSSDPPAIIFLDYDLPLMNGIECLKQIRSNKEYDDIPIVFYSGYLDKIQQAYENGANYFIVKQLTTDKTKSSISSVLSRNWKDRDTFKNFEVIFRDDQKYSSFAFAARVTPKVDIDPAINPGESDK